jgi:hypothetical protein
MLVVEQAVEAVKEKLFFLEFWILRTDQLESD